MKPKPKFDRAWVLKVSRAIASELKQRAQGTPLRVRIPRQAIRFDDTDGWRAVIGDIGSTNARLEIWFDKFTGHRNRKLYACFQAERRKTINAITGRVSKKLWPIRRVSLSDVAENGRFALLKPLRQGEFNLPILETYRGGTNYYGIFAKTNTTSPAFLKDFAARALGFFEDIARTLPGATDEKERDEIYPQFENRLQVASHLRRERSKLLAAECKIRDGYACQVCGLRFEDLYGAIGRNFAEAHHLVPLASLRENVKTHLEDLITVCANCHRVLHRMRGTPTDFKKLKKVMRRPNRRRHLTPQNRKK